MLKIGQTSHTLFADESDEVIPWTALRARSQKQNKSQVNIEVFCLVISKVDYIFFQGYPIHQLASILFFIIPVGVLLFLYISMAITLHGSFNNKTLGGAAGSVHGERQINSSRKQIIRMLGR